jgi:hypothetical protein
MVESVRQMLGLSDQAMRDFLIDTQTPIFRHPADKRRRLIRDEDAQKLLRPQPDRTRKSLRDAVAA